MAQRKSFIVHRDSLSVLDELSNEQAGMLFKAIKAYQCGADFELDQLTKIIFAPFKSQFERDEEKYKKTCEARAAAGSKGGKQKVANASKSKQKQANVADSKSKNKSDSKSKNESKSEDQDLNTVSPCLDFSSWPSTPSDQVFKDWKALRTKLKAPISETVIKSFGKQLTIAAEAGFSVDDCLAEACSRGWRGFKAEWMANANRGSKSKHDLSGQNYVEGDL